MAAECFEKDPSMPRCVGSLAAGTAIHGKMRRCGREGHEQRAGQGRRQGSGQGFGAGRALVVPECQLTLHDCYEFALSLIGELSISASAADGVPDYLVCMLEGVSAALARGRCVDEDSPGILGAELVAVAVPRASSDDLFVEDRGPGANGEVSHGFPGEVLGRAPAGPSASAVGFSDPQWWGGCMEHP